MDNGVILPQRNKKDKVQWGIYIDKVMHDKVKDLARRSSVSYNEAINQVLEAGIQALEAE